MRKKSGSLLMGRSGGIRASGEFRLLPLLLVLVVVQGDNRGENFQAIDPADLSGGLSLGSVEAVIQVCVDFCTQTLIHKATMLSQLAGQDEVVIA